MRGDFSQLYADDPNLIAVLQRQGRLILDADLNEQTLIDAVKIDALAADATALGGQVNEIRNALVGLVSKLRGIADGADVNAVRTALKSVDPITAPPDLAFVRRLVLAGGQLTLPDSLYIQGRRLKLSPQLRGPHSFDVVKKWAPDATLVAGEYHLYAELGLLAVYPADRLDPALSPGDAAARLRMTNPKLVLKSAALPANDRKIPLVLQPTAEHELGNHLYRFEVFEEAIGATTVRKLKWSRDNASETFRVLVSVPKQTPPLEAIETDTVTINEPPEMLARVREGQHIEFLLPASIVPDGWPASKLVQISKKGDGPEITLASKISIELGPEDKDSDKRRAIFTRWELAGPIEDFATAKPLGNSGFKLQITGWNSTRAGDYWTVPVRSGSQGAGSEIVATLRSAAIYELIGKVAVSATDITSATPQSSSTAAVDFSPVGGAVEIVAAPQHAADVAADPAASIAALSSRAASSAVIHDLPLRLLDLHVEMPALKQWIASADWSEVCFLPAEQLNEKLLRAIEVPEEERAAFDADVQSLTQQFDLLAQQPPFASSQLSFA